MNKDDLAAALAALRTAQSVLITSHANPDGDAIGGMLALGHLLRVLGVPRAVCANDDPVPRLYRWLPGADQIQETRSLPERLDVDTMILLDASTRDRAGAIADRVPDTAKLVVIDHHLEDCPEGDVRLIDARCSAVGEIIVELFGASGAPLTPEAATCLYVSIITDTGGFRYANTTPNTHRIAATLIEAGLDVAEISSRVFEVISAPKFEMLRCVLGRLVIEVEGRLAHSTIRAEDMRAVGARSEDVDGLVNYPRNIEGVEVGILFRELDAQSTKVSMRSRDGFNCAQFLKTFGGGGHAGAAGAFLAMPLDAARTLVLEHARRALGEIR